jgi:predicted nucleotidyltransferase
VVGFQPRFLREKQMDDKFVELKRYFEEKENVILAFAFGSSVRGFAGEDSDLDIGVYLINRGEEDEIWREISKIAEREIDLIVLNNSPESLISNVFKTGIPLVIKDRKIYWDLYLAKTLEAEDFSEFAEGYWKIYSRSASLIPEDKTRLLERIQFLESEYHEIEGFNKLTFEEYREDKIKRRNIERWTENIINATVDIAKIILASEKKEIPKTY